MKKELLPYIEKELIAVLGDRPVYNITNVDVNKFPYKITDKTLLIGDGINHPILVIKDAIKAMMHYVITEEAFDFENVDDISSVTGFTDKETCEIMIFKLDKTGHYIFDDFTDNDLIDFINMCKSDVLKNPYQENPSLIFQDWLHINFGELIWHHHSHIADFTTFDLYEYFEENFLKHKKFKPKYDNFSVEPNIIENYKELFQENNRKIIIKSFQSKNAGKIYNDLIAGNGWDFEDIFFMYKHDEY